MKPLKNLTLILLVASLLVPFASSANTEEIRTFASSKSIEGMKLGIFDFLKKEPKNANETYYKLLEKKRRIAKAHRRSLLRKVKKSKSF